MRPPPEIRERRAELELLDRRVDFARAVAWRMSRLREAAAGFDDHAETVLLNLLRGTEPKGLLGIPWKRELCRAGRRRVSPTPPTRWRCPTVR